MARSGDPYFQGNYEPWHSPIWIADAEVENNNQGSFFSLLPRHLLYIAKGKEGRKVIFPNLLSFHFKVASQLTICSSFNSVELIYSCHT